MNERIKELRRTLELTLKKFGERVGISEGAVSNIEKGKRGVSNQLIKSICREFSVDYIWLTTGEGEMFHYTDGFTDQKVKRIMEGENTVLNGFLRWLATLNDEDIVHIQKMMTSFVEFTAKEKKRNLQSGLNSAIE